MDSISDVIGMSLKKITDQKTVKFFGENVNVYTTVLLGHFTMQL